MCGARTSVAVCPPLKSCHLFLLSHPSTTTTQLLGVDALPSSASRLESPPPTTAATVSAALSDCSSALLSCMRMDSVSRLLRTCGRVERNKFSFGILIRILLRSTHLGNLLQIGVEYDLGLVGALRLHLALPLQHLGVHVHILIGVLRQSNQHSLYKTAA